MVSTTAPFTLQQIGTGTSRFPSGVALPTITDASVDPYIRTRPIQTVQVECIEFWPQEKGTYPGIVLLHEWWGLNSQIKDLGARLAGAAAAAAAGVWDPPPAPGCVGRQWQD